MVVMASNPEPRQEDVDALLFTVEKMGAENQKLRRIIRAFIEADERGRGLPWDEAMDAARKEISK